MLILVPHGLLASVMCWIWWPKSAREWKRFGLLAGVSHSVLVDHVFCVRDVKEVSLMLGVKRVNRESVHGSMKVVLAPNIGLEEFRSLHTLE